MKNRVKYVPKRIAVIEKIFYIVCILFLLWITISWVDVNIHNQIPNYHYSDLNFFTYF